MRIEDYAQELLKIDSQLRSISEMADDDREIEFEEWGRLDMTMQHIRTELWGYLGEIRLRHPETTIDTEPIISLL